MPKLKTHSGTKDRVTITKNGKVRRRHAYISHFLQKKSASRKRTFAGLETISTADAKHARKRMGV